MSAETLRRAAALMRELAEAVENPDGADGTLPWREEWGNWLRLADADAQHIASWHPDVALAVANLLDVEAAMCEEFAIDEAETPESLTVARAYLGDSA